MFAKLVKAIFGSRNERLLKKHQKTVAAINGLEASYKALSDQALRKTTERFKSAILRGQSLESILPEAFAACREAARRHLGLRHFDVQLIGGIVLHEGKISEMQTGEGKTLVATLPAYLNALVGKGVHIVTVNDYLAARDAKWMAPVYEALGLSVGVIVTGLSPQVRKEAYQADITYATNNELGFDYLRDNMAMSPNEQVGRDPFYAIVDEVDSILIDEARTPLIISGQVDDLVDLYKTINQLIPSLTRQLTEEEEGDYSVEEKTRQVSLTEEGQLKIESLLLDAGLLSEDASLYESQNIALLHHINAGIRAHAVFKRDVDYIVKDNKIMIIDEHTGRPMPGRRWSEGLHQAIEAKEGVAIQKESQTLASITFQNYFRLYRKLSGMTGTADTEAHEFQSIYGLEVVAIPPNRPNQRQDHADNLYRDTDDKYEAIIDNIEECRKSGRPVLVGTTSIESSERLSEALEASKIPHNVLNAKQHAREAEIIAEAGRAGSVTIATNMAGRGTDIVLGGSLQVLLDEAEDADEEDIAAMKLEWQKQHDAVVAAGGLHIIGTDRHESRRIDNQLRGRAGRQGDPGSSRFYLSLEDHLLRIFVPETMRNMLATRLEKGEVLSYAFMSRTIENAQRKVEGFHFDTRKHLLEYDNVANEQRTFIYQERRGLMAAESVSDVIADMQKSVVERLIEKYLPSDQVEANWNVEGLQKELDKQFASNFKVADFLKERNNGVGQVKERVIQMLVANQQSKRSLVGEDAITHLEKIISLQVLDKLWQEHLANMDYLKQSIGFRSYAQKQPMQEYKKESYELFSRLLESFEYDVVSILSRLEIQTESEVNDVEQKHQSKPHDIEYQHGDESVGKEENKTEEKQPFRRDLEKVGRNDVCPCGSGKKYKRCHGQLNAVAEG